MSDTQQGPDWWQASDEKWYPPPRPDWPPAPNAEPAAAPTEPVAEVPEESESDATEIAPPTPSAEPTQATPPLAPPADGAPPRPSSTGMPDGPPSDSDPFFGPPGTGASAAGDPFGTPDKNRTPLIIGGVIAVVLAVIIGALVFGGGDDKSAEQTSDTTKAPGSGIPGNKEGDPGSSPDSSPPASSDFPEFVDPADAEAVTVDESGFILIPDEFDQGVTNASYGFVITNPNEDLAATSVEMTIGLFDQAGTAVETESAFVSGLLGGQTIGMGGFVRDVPEGVVRIEVTSDASQFVRTADLGGELTIANVTSTPEDFGGITVTFDVTSTFDVRQENLTLYGVFRNEAGDPIGGSLAFLEFVEANGTSRGEIRSFAEIPGIASVDPSVTVSASTFFD